MVTTELRQWIHQVSGQAYCKVPTLWTTYYLTRLVLELNVLGDLVECGVAAGVHPAVMARACMDAGAQQTIHLFDSFAGIPKPGPNDPPETAVLEGKAACSLAQVKANLKGWGVAGVSRFVYHEGLFENTVPLVDVFPIALLRLDGDLYSSTKVCLDHLEPRLSGNGFLTIDDGMAGVRKAWSEYFVTDGFAPLYWQKGQK